MIVAGLPVNIDFRVNTRMMFLHRGFECEDIHKNPVIFVKKACGKCGYKDIACIFMDDVWSLPDVSNPNNACAHGVRD